MAKTLTKEQQEINRLQKQIDDIKDKQREQNKKILNNKTINKQFEELGFVKDEIDDYGVTWCKKHDSECRIMDYVTYDINNPVWEFLRQDDDYNCDDLINKTFDSYDDLLAYLLTLTPLTKKKYVFTYEFEAYECDDVGEIIADEINNLYDLEPFVKEVE